MADRENMSVDEIIAACRQADGGEAADAAPETADAAPAEPAQPEAPAAPEKPAAKSSGGRPSIAEMMAMARGEKSDEPAASQSATEDEPAAEAEPAKAVAKSGGGRPSIAEMMAMARGEGEAAKPAAKKPAAKKPSAKKAAPEKKAAPAAGGPRDTASILAAARKPVKPGPMSKAEAAAVGMKETGKKKIVAPPMPEKPAYAAAPPKPEVDSDRRVALMSMVVGSFMALGFSSMAATFGLWTLGMARFMFPNILREPPSQFKVGPPDQYTAGVVETKFKAQFAVWVVKGTYNGQEQIYALQSVCTHLGCTPNWLEAEQKFKCPCHGSGFYKDGINFEGPAPRPLERFAISIADDGQLLIDKSKTFQEEMGEWEDPTSFVAV